MDIPQGDSTYDAATANMGSRWKMPTKDQGQELINETNHIWTTINGVNGRKFTSKTYSTKYILLPAAGDWYELTSRDKGSVGHYWNTKHVNAGKVSHLYLTSSAARLNPSLPYVGFSVRAIQ